MATPTAEQTFDTDVTSGAGFTFTAATPSITETAAGPTAAAPQTIDSDVAGATLTGNGVNPALTVASGVTVEIDNVSIANSGAASSVALGAGSTVIFGDGDMGNLDAGAANLGNISAPITGATGNVQINGAFNNDLAVKFSAADTYGGSTTIGANAELVFGANGSINNSGTATGSTVTIAASGTLDASGAQTSTGAATTLVLHNLADTGTIVLGSNSLETAGASTIGGAVTGTGGLQIGPVGGTAAANTTTVSDALAYTGSTKIYGDLALTGAGSIADSSNVSLKATGATFDISGVTDEGGGATVGINELTGVAGSIVTLGANSLVVTESVTAASFSGVINGTGGLTVAPGEAGTFELTLAGKNTYTGDTNIEVGTTLGLAGAGTLGAGPTAAVAGGAAATPGSALTLDGTLDISQLTTGSFTLGAFATDVDTSSVTAGANRLIVESPTTPDTLGTVTGVGGSLQVGTAAGATPAAGMVAATPDATSLTLTGTSTYTGSTVVYGHLVVDGSISASSNVSLKVAGASVDFSGAADNGTFFTTSDVSSTGATETGVLINELTGVAGTTVSLPTAAFSPLIINETTNASFSGAIEGGEGYGIVVRGPATLTLNGTNTYTGETLIKGHLDLGAGGSIANSGVYDNGVFDVSGATGPVIIDGLSGDNANATVVLGGNTLIINGDDAEEFGGQQFAFAGAISGSGGLTVNDEVELSGTNTYTGVTTVNGELDLVSGTVSDTSSIVNNGDIELYVSGSQTAISVPTAIISGTGEVDFYGYSDATGYTATPLTATISVAETYSGETFVDNVDLIIGAGGSIANSFVELYNGDGMSTLDISGAGGAVTIQGIESFDGSGAVVLGSNTLILSGAGNTTADLETFEGVISGSGGLQINSGAGLIFSEAQTYTGSTVVYGVVELEGAGRLASSNVSLKAANGVGGSLDISEATVTAAAPTVVMNELTGQFGSHVYLGGNTLEVTETVAASFGGVISDGTTMDAVTGAGGVVGLAGGLTVDGSAFLTLTNTETYTGLTTVNGDLALGAATGSSTIGSIADSSGLLDNGIFSIVGGSATIGSLSGTGVVKIGPAPDVLTVNQTATTTFSGTIHGAGILEVTGNHTLILSGATSDYSGGTELFGTGSLGMVGGAATVATLELTALHAAGSGAITFEADSSVLQITNAALTGGGTATESFANVITFASESAGNYVDLSDLTFETANSGAAQTFRVGADGSLAIHEGNVTATFHLGAAAAGDTFTAVNDGTGHTAFHLVG